MNEACKAAAVEAVLREKIVAIVRGAAREKLLPNGT